MWVFFVFLFFIGNTRTIINEKKKKKDKYKLFMMMNNKKQIKQTTNNREGDQKDNLRENINFERDEESVKLQQ